MHINADHSECAYKLLVNGCSCLLALLCHVKMSCQYFSLDGFYIMLTRRGLPCSVGRPRARPGGGRPATRPARPPAACPPAALQTTTDAREQNSTGPLGGPVTISVTFGVIVMASHCESSPSMQTQRQMAVNPQTKPTDLGCDPSVAIYRYALI